MRFVVVGSSHFTDSTLKIIRKTDPHAIIFFIERSSEVSETIAKRYNAIPIHGDLTEVSTYIKAEIDKADVFIAITDSDALNIKIARIASEIYHVPRVFVWLNNPLNKEALSKDTTIKPITLQECFENQLELELASDTWVEIPLPSTIGLKMLFFRFNKFSYTDLTPRRIIEGLKDIDVTIFFYSNRGNLIENYEKVLGIGDYLVIVGEKDIVENAKRKIDGIISKSLVSTTGLTGISSPYKVG